MRDLHTSLPNTSQAYLLRDREGTRYLIDTQLVTLIASAASSGGLFELVSVTGCRNDHFPAHRHARAHEGIYVQEGLVEVRLGDECYLLAPGDYAHIPAGAVHAYTLRSHNARLLSVTSKGEVGKVYAQIGTATDLHVHPPHAEAVDIAARLAESLAGTDLELVDAPPAREAQLVTNVTVLDAHCTRFFSVLAPGIFEPFFHTLGSPYDGFIFPPEPGPARFDRLMQKVQAGELDLKVVGPPPDGSPGPGRPPGVPGGPPSSH